MGQLSITHSLFWRCTVNETRLEQVCDKCFFPELKLSFQLNQSEGEARCFLWAPNRHPNHQNKYNWCWQCMLLQTTNVFIYIFFFTKNPWLELGEDHVLTQKQTRPERSAIKTTEWVTAYKCWNAVLSSGLLLGTYIATTNPNTSKHESQLICMYCKCDMTYICRNVDMIHIQIWTHPCIKHKKPTVYPGYWAIQLCV